MTCADMHTGSCIAIRSKSVQCHKPWTGCTRCFSLCVLYAMKNVFSTSILKPNSEEQSESVSSVWNAGPCSQYYQCCYSVAESLHGRVQLSILRRTNILSVLGYISLLCKSFARLKAQRGSSYWSPPVLAAFSVWFVLGVSES